MAKTTKKAAKWRRAFLSALARTANARLAAAMAGVDHATVYLLRQRDPGFAAAWPRARDWGRARVKAEGRPVHSNGRPQAAPRGGPPDPRALVLRRSKREGAQIVRAGEGRWTPEAEGVFLDHLAAGFGVRYSAAAAGFSTTAVYARRRLSPDFGERWTEAKAHGIERNDMLLIDSVQWTLDPEAVEAAQHLPRPTIAEAIQIQRLYRPGGEEGGGRRGRWTPRPRSLDEVRDSILTKLEAIGRHREREQLAEGWSKAEDGTMIPPGWVRAAPDAAGEGD